jgi:acyl-CoA thioesterase II
VSETNSTCAPDDWLALEPTEDGNRFTLTVTPGISTSGGFIYGGAGLGLGATALELATGRPVVWATAQFLRFTGPGTKGEIVVDEPVRGHFVSQARCSLVCDGEEILMVSGALGRRDYPTTARWVKPPDVPGPERCPQIDRWWAGDGTAASRFDLLDANSFLDAPPSETGRAAYWGRVPELGAKFSSLKLALLGDTHMTAFSAALGDHVGSNSLDNTMRIMDPVDCEWVLIDHRLEDIGLGMASATGYFWSPDGHLLGSVAQTLRIKKLPPEHPAFKESPHG